MKKIKVTPAELLTQAGEMESLEKEYDALFSKVSSVINEANQNWSENLARNFSGKLTSAQKSFGNVTGMLRQGAAAAKTSARSFESMDSLLAKGISGGETTEANRTGMQEINMRSNAVLLGSNIRGMNTASCFSADPVNLANGNFVYEKEYLRIDSAVPMSLRIFYNSNGDVQGALGKGWLHNYEIRLRHKPGQIIINREDGSEQMFFADDDVYTCVNATFGSLTKDADGYRFVDRSQDVWTFDQEGYLKARENKAGDRVDLVYDWDQRLIKVVNEAGDSLTFAYDGQGALCRVEDHSGRGIDLKVTEGRLVSVSDGLGETVTYAYNVNGLLAEIVNGRGIKTLVNEYDEEDRTVAQTFADGGVMSYVYHEDRSVDLVQQNGAVITYHHDALMRNLKTVYPNGEEIFTYNDHNQRTSATDRRGNTTFYSYDAQGNMVEVVNARRDVMAMTYNAKGQILSVALNGDVQYTAEYDEADRLCTMTDGLGGQTRYEYDDKGQVVAWIQPDGSHQNYTYDEYGHVKTVTNAMGGQTEYEYDALHRVVKTTDAMGHATTYTYDDADRIVSTTDAMGYVRTYTYDGSGNVIAYKDGNDGVTRTTYTVMNKPETVTDPDGNTTRFEYDLMWNLTRLRYADGGEEVFTYDEMNQMISALDPEGGENRLTYDANGNLIQRVDPEGGVHKLAYDELNRPVEITDPMGRVAQVEYNVHGGEACVIHPDGSRTEQTFDSLGRVVEQTDRCGYTRTFTYDAMGQIVEIADALGWKERWEYYPGGLVKCVREREGAVTIYEYDENERIVALVNETGGRWTLEYDALDRPVRVYADGKLAEAYEYDAEGNVLAQIDGDGNRTTYRYSAGGNLIAMTDATGYETTYEYDGRNRVTKVVQPERMVDGINAVHAQNRQVRETLYHRDKRGLVVEAIDPEGNRQTYTYDKCGRQIASIDADGHRMDTEYYADGLAKAYHTSDGRSILMQYDALKQLIQLEDALGITRIVRDEKTSLPAQVTNPQGETIAYEWEVDGRRKSISYPDGKKQIFAYDELGRMSSVEVDGETIRYEYDGGGRLIRKSYSGGAETRYVFDTMGYASRMTHTYQGQILEDYAFSYAYPGKKSGVRRQSSVADWSGDYTYRYDVRGSLTGVLKDGVEIESYQYDDFGNRTYSVVNGKTSSYAYNRLNQLVSMTDEEGTHGYTYDHCGNMIAETLNGRTVLQMQFDATGMLSHAQSDKGTAQYIYNGFGQRYEENISLQGKAIQRRFGYDITKDNRNLLFMSSEEGLTDLFWDNEIIGVTEKDGMSYFMNDALSNPIRRIRHSDVKACQYTAFGCQMTADGANSDDWHGQTFIGYVADPITDLYHSPRREYSPKAGQFISTDSVIGHLSVPLAFHAYHYCMGEPINYWDPTGALAAWLAGGIVGSVAKVVSKAAGDVVKSAVASVKKGKLTWEGGSGEDYIAAAAGGFVEGTVLATTGNFAAAGAAGAATETFTANGMKMLLGKEGYRKEDGYTFGSLVGDTVKSGATGAAVGAAGGYLFKNAGGNIKIPGVTSGRGSYLSVWKANITKAGKDLIENMSRESLAKGIVVFGGVGFIDGVWSGLVSEGKKAADGWLKKKTGEVIGEENVERVEQAYEIWENIDDARKKATCAATA